MNPELEKVIERIKAARKKVRTPTSQDEVADTTRPDNSEAAPPPSDPGWYGSEIIAGTGNGATLNENERPQVY